ncbi:hypothetical protein Tco_0570173 [Tanacetum coccineum]
MMERELGEGYSFIKKKCFVCGSLSHLIKDCDYYEKKMAREAEFKKQRVFNTGNRVAKPVWTNANRVNHANQFVPRSVQLNAGRPNINSVRPNINTGRTNVNSVRPNINYVRQNVNSVRTNINTVRSKQPVPTNNTNSFSPVRPQGSSTQAHGGRRQDKVGNLDFAVLSSGKELGHVTPKTSHLNAVKRIFKYLKGKPNLGLWYPRESSFDLEAFSDGDYTRANLDRKSTTGGCQFLGSRLISW